MNTLISYYKEDSAKRRVNPMHYPLDNRIEAREQGQSKLRSGNILYYSSQDWWLLEYGQVENHFPTEEIREYFDKLICENPSETVFEYRMTDSRYRCTVDYAAEPILRNFNDSHEVSVWLGQDNLANYHQYQAERDAMKEEYEALGANYSMLDILLKPDIALFSDQMTTLEANQYYEGVN